MSGKDRETREAAERHLREDPVLGPVVESVGPFTLKLQRNRFQMLVRSILSQQVSVAAARTFRKRLHALFRPGRPTAARMCEMSVDDLREAGISRQKAGYLIDLAAKVHAGEVDFRRLHRLDDEGVIAELTQIKGIGRWTAQMFLIFSLGRPDVWPTGDLGIRSAVRQLHDLNELPSEPECERLAEPWRPYASVASWYCWRMLDG